MISIDTHQHMQDLLLLIMHRMPGDSACRHLGPAWQLLRQLLVGQSADAVKLKHIAKRETNIFLIKKLAWILPTRSH